MVQPLARPLLEEQAVLAQRFRLLRTLSAGDEASWLAHDDVLDREVVVIALPARDARGRALLEQAGSAGAVSHSGLARVYDAAYESRPPRPRAAYVVREWVDGHRLHQLLVDGPVTPGRALELTTQAARALAALHAAGTTHGRVHPGNLVLDAADRVHLTDAGTSAVRAGVPQDEATDVRDLGAVLYALSTGRWPAGATAQPGGALLTAPTDARGVVSPGTVREGVPRALDQVVMRVLSSRPGMSPILTASALVSALEQAVETVAREEREAQPPEPGPPARWRRYVPYAGVLAGLVILATCSYSVGQRVGEVPGTEDSVASIEEDIETAPGAAPEVRVDLLRAAVIRSFDPAGADGRENPSTVLNAFDLEPSTAWETELYRTAAFGGLKDGVGLLVDLRRPTPLSRVVLDLTVPGATMELRGGNAVGASADSLPVIARGVASRDGQRLQLRPEQTRSLRYYLLWITDLPGDGSQFRAGITEMAFLRR